MKKPVKQQVAIFLHLIGEEALEILQHIFVIDCEAKARRLIPEIRLSFFRAEIQMSSH